MLRRLYIGLALALPLAAGVLLWWVLSGPRTSPPTQQPVAGLADTVSIGWTHQHTVSLHASTPSDALTALGYAHGMTRPWTITIWRRTALGTLSRTFGKGLVPIDEHARRLGFAHHAEQTYKQLSTTDRKRLQAYARGLNAALSSDRVRRRTPFIYLNVSPQRWEPWHSLAIERLLAWTGTELSSLLSDRAKLSGFRHADRLLRRWLHLHGRTQSIVWAAQPRADTSRAALFARHVLGATAEPVIQEVELRLDDSSHTLLASLPGTLLFPTGTSPGRAWGYMLGSPAQLQRKAVDTTRTRHERLRPPGTDEQLLEVNQYDHGLLLSAPAPDSAWVLHWPGFRPQTDFATWTDLAIKNAAYGESDAASFHLFDGNGLSLNADGNWTVQGEPSIVERSPGSILVGGSDWSHHKADVLRAHRTSPSFDPARWSRSDSSSWAGALLSRLLPALDPLSGTAPVLDDALSYLRNWDHAYEPASIGAVVFEQWMRAYRAEIGRLPVASDSAYMAGPRGRRTFQNAIATLVQRYGTDVRRWRWERVAPDHRYFPVWSADSLVATDLSPLNTTQFAPLDKPGWGHASTLAGGPTLVDPLPIGPAPTAWDGWMTRGAPDLTVRRQRFDPSAFFARSLLPRDPPEPVSVGQASVSKTTRLVPAQP